MRVLRSVLLLMFACLFMAACSGNVTDNNSSNDSNVSENSTIEDDGIIRGDGYTMKKTEAERGYVIELNFDEKNYNSNNQPFDNRFYTGEKIITMDGSVNSKRALISYTKREGGTYIYSNNPEMLAPEDIGQAILRTENLSGDCVFTYEHSNHTGKPVYLGYQLKNDGDTEVTVTVTNLGFQKDGEWLGQRSWSDYFNYRFELPADYFLANGEVNPIYVGCDYLNYTPKVRKPVTVTIPAGEYIYVLGGTSLDAYNNTNIFGTANTYIMQGKCSNAVVKFNVSGGSVTGTFYCYTNPKQVQANPKEQGFITERFNSATNKMTDYSKQYKGVDPTAGLIESNITFVVDNSTRNGRLPVSYLKDEDPNYASKNTPYAEYSPQQKAVLDDEWMTSLNPNSVKNAIGTDMMIFQCVDTDGNPIVIDTLRADSSGEPANIGNWMVQYTDNFTLVNAADEDKTFTFFKRGSGMLFTMVRDDEGNIIEANALTQPYSFASLADVFAGVDTSLLMQKNGRYWFKVADGRPYCDVYDERSQCYQVTVPANSVERVSIDYVILGNSNGGIRHWVELS
jgi:hypothetical protein